MWVAISSPGGNQVATVIGTKEVLSLLGATGLHAPSLESEEITTAHEETQGCLVSRSAMQHLRT